MSAGEVWLEVETMSHGRIRSPHPFIYQSKTNQQDDPSIAYSIRGRAATDGANPLKGDDFDCKQQTTEGEFDSCFLINYIYSSPGAIFDYQ